MQLRRPFFPLLFALLFSFILFLPLPAAHAAPNPFKNIPVTGTVDGGGSFAGKLTVVGFEVLNGQLTALGQLNGVLKNASGKSTPVNKALVALPVSNGSSGAAQVAACDVLHLRLGPLDLDLLGLVVHLDTVVLDITAQPGPGNLLGNLLCAITGLLDSTDLTNLLNLASLLNALLGLLG